MNHQTTNTSQTSFWQILGNVIWLIFGGFIISLQYFLSGILLCLSIVGIPFAMAVFRLGYLSLLPFGKRVSQPEVTESFWRTVCNILWAVFFGLWIALNHLILALILAITIIGWPFAKQHVKLAELAIKPFGVRVV